MALYLLLNYSVGSVIPLAGGEGLAGGHRRRAG